MTLSTASARAVAVCGGSQFASYAQAEAVSRVLSTCGLLEQYVTGGAASAIAGSSGGR